MPLGARKFIKGKALTPKQVTYKDQEQQLRERPAINSSVSHLKLIIALGRMPLSFFAFPQHVLVRESRAACHH